MPRTLCNDEESTVSMRDAFGYRVRECFESDLDDIVSAHVASIRLLCAGFYSSDLIADWVSPINAQKYRDAIEQGATIFVAEGKGGKMLGFSETHQVRDHEFNAAVFVRKEDSRKGVGTALYRAAESFAVQSGATTIELNASLAAVQFYLAQGFEKCERQKIEVSAGRYLSGIRMRKMLSRIR